MKRGYGKRLWEEVMGRRGYEEKRPWEEAMRERAHEGKSQP